MAILHLQSVLSVAPNDLSARTFLAQELLKSKRLEEALAEFSRVVKADPDNEDALLEQVKILEQKRQYKQALDSVEKATRNTRKRGGRQRRWPICSRLHHSTICAQALGRWNSPN